MNREMANVTMSIDVRKSRIRLHKAMMSEIGNPNYIQILINQEKMILAIKGVAGKSAGDHTHRLKYKFTSSDQSIELYSDSLVTKLCGLVEKMDDMCTYRLEGKVNHNQRIAYFSLLNMKRCDS